VASPLQKIPCLPPSRNNLGYRARVLAELISDRIFASAFLRAAREGKPLRRPKPGSSHRTRLPYCEYRYRCYLFEPSGKTPFASKDMGLSGDSS